MTSCLVFFKHPQVLNLIILQLPMSIVVMNLPKKIKSIYLKSTPTIMKQ
jgi:hypothetical protein